MRKFIVLSMALQIGLTGCAQLSTRSNQAMSTAGTAATASGADEDQAGLPAVLPGKDEQELQETAEGVDVEAEEAVTMEEAEQKVADVQVPPLENATNFPHDMNPLVEKWLDYFQGRGRHHMERYLGRSTRYLPMMKEELRKKGLSEDLVYVALIESGFNSVAHSHANAVGYWQFISGTGLRYGLQINSLIDERRDPVLSTRAAANYLKGLYAVFGNWYLAIAAYNAGENRIKNIVMDHYTRDFWTLARKRVLPVETMNYVPKFLAARMIASNPEKYGFSSIEYQPALAYEELRVTKPVHLHHLARHMGVSYSDLKSLNPAFKGSVAPVTRGRELVIRVPVGTSEQAYVAVNKSYAAGGNKYMLASRPARGSYITYRVRRGDNVAKIASRYGVTVASIRQLNGMKSGNFLRVGHRLRVPVGDGRQVAGMDTKTTTAKPTKTVNSERVHIVRRGDTLIQIAKTYNVSMRELANRNNLGPKRRIMAGSKLIIPAN